MSSASPKALVTYPVLGLVAVTRAALGCGIGIMVANKFQRSSTRQTTAIALLSVGVPRQRSVPGTVDLAGYQSPGIQARNESAPRLHPRQRRLRRRRRDFLKE